MSRKEHEPYFPQFARLDRGRRERFEEPRNGPGRGVDWKVRRRRVRILAVDEFLAGEIAEEDTDD